ncbi:hypothetical protein NC653_026217 [Populus alba x Populus x berolinensis]|uniref:Uncharacterized protein n=1 Tax=Populus alba x Populus x berolinensis TaxID=444605 RepID=A0AAD6MD57_9ROSI|nr:hypothetical protein NC653_026217 [Populus alba x Populus x berolinensis]
MGKASYDGRFIRAPSPTLKARVCKGSIVIFKRIRFSLRAKELHYAIHLIIWLHACLKNMSYDLKSRCYVL